MANRKNCSLRSVFLRWDSLNFSRYGLGYVILPFLRSGSKPFPSDRYVDIFICNLEFYCFHIKFAKCGKCQLKQTGYFPKRAEPFSFRCAEFASFFAGRKAEQTFFSDFNTPCDSSRIRANRTWLIAKTARCARSFCDGIASIFLVTV